MVKLMFRLAALSLAFAGALALGGCVSPTGPGVYAFRAQPMHPEGWYEDAYDSLVACLTENDIAIGSGKSYAQLEWFMAPAGSMVRPSGEKAVGLFSSPNRIYVDELWVMEVYIIAHEEAHYLTDVLDHVGQAGEWARIENTCVRPVAGIEVP